MKEYIFTLEDIYNFLITNFQLDEYLRKKLGVKNLKCDGNTINGKISFGKFWGVKIKAKWKAKFARYGEGTLYIKISSDFKHKSVNDIVGRLGKLSLESGNKLKIPIDKKLINGIGLKSITSSEDGRMIHVKLARRGAILIYLMKFNPLRKKLIQITKNKMDG